MLLYQMAGECDRVGPRSTAGFAVAGTPDSLDLVMCDRVGVAAAAQAVIPGDTLRERGTAAALGQTKPEVWLLWPNLGVMIEPKLS